MRSKLGGVVKEIKNSDIPEGAIYTAYYNNKSNTRDTRTSFARWVFR